jgi:hypothetical protein
MLGDDAPVLADYDAIGVSMDLDGTTDSIGGDGVLIIVKAHQAGLRDRRRYRVEAIERAEIS